MNETDKKDTRINKGSCIDQEMYAFHIHFEDEMRDEMPHDS
jgi:hypothetical protein